MKYVREREAKQERDLAGRTQRAPGKARALEESASTFGCLHQPRRTTQGRPQTMLSKCHTVKVSGKYGPDSSVT